MKHRVFAAFIALVLGRARAAPGWAGAAGEGTTSVVAVIVHPENPVPRLGPAELRSIYTNNILRWADGTPIKLYDLVVDSRARGVFSEKVLGRPAYEVDEEWARLKITNQAANPPLTVKSERDIIRKVSREKGAIGYVSLYLVKGNKDVRIIATLY
ncbi:MAG: substrate-binding domain-containing protein [Thermodesulfobacteriota bacterium]